MGFGLSGGLGGLTIFWKSLNPKALAYLNESDGLYLVSNLSVIVDIRYLEHLLDLQLRHLDWEAPHDELELNLGQKLLMDPVFFGSIQLRKRLSTTQHLIK